MPKVKTRITNNSSWLQQREIGQRALLGYADRFSKRLYSSIIPCTSWDHGENLRHAMHGGVFNLEFSPDGSLLVAACEKKSILMFDPLCRRLIHAVDNAHRDCVNCVRFLDSRVFATCSDDSTVSLWDARNLKSQIRTLHGHSNWVKNIEFSPRDGLLVTSGFDGSIYTWDINSYTESGFVYNRVFQTNGLMRTRLNPDASKMIICTTGGYLIIIHNLDLTTMAQDLAGFKPNMYRLMQLSQTTIPVAADFTHLFSRHRKTNRVEFVTDFPTGDDAEVVSSLQIHPQGWCALSRNISNDENSEWTCVHDIQDMETSDGDNESSFDSDNEDDDCSQGAEDKISSTRPGQQNSHESDSDSDTENLNHHRRINRLQSAVTSFSSSLVIDTDSRVRIVRPMVELRMGTVPSSSLALVLGSGSSNGAGEDGGSNGGNGPRNEGGGPSSSSDATSSSVGNVVNSRTGGGSDSSTGVANGGENGVGSEAAGNTNADVSAGGDGDSGAAARTSGSSRNDDGPSSSSVAGSSSSSSVGVVIGARTGVIPDNVVANGGVNGASREAAVGTSTGTSAGTQAGVVAARRTPGSQINDDGIPIDARRRGTVGDIGRRGISPANVELHVSSADVWEALVAIREARARREIERERRERERAMRMRANLEHRAASQVGAGNLEERRPGLVRILVRRNVDGSRGGIGLSVGSGASSAQSNDEERRERPVHRNFQEYGPEDWVDLDEEDPPTARSPQTPPPGSSITNALAAVISATSAVMAATSPVVSTTTTANQGTNTFSDREANVLRSLAAGTGTSSRTVLFLDNHGIRGGHRINSGPSYSAPRNHYIHQNVKRLTHYIEEPNVGKGFIKELCFSADGRLISSPFGYGVRLLAFSPECAELSTCVPSRPPVQLYELNTHVCHADIVVSTKFSPQHCILVSGCLSGKIVWHQPVV